MNFPVVHTVEVTINGLDHDARIRHWQQAMREGQRLRDEFAAFIERPDLSRLRAI